MCSNALPRCSCQQQQQQQRSPCPLLPAAPHPAPPTLHPSDPPPPPCAGTFLMPHGGAIYNFLADLKARGLSTKDDLDSIIGPLFLYHFMQVGGPQRGQWGL